MIEPKVSFIIPLYNEAAVLLKLIERLDALVKRIEFACEIVLIDDGSVDETPLIMTKLAFDNPIYHCIFLSRNFGHQIAVSAGLQNSQATEAVMILDGDLQDPPELFFEFYNQLHQGYDVVYGIRKRRKENYFKRSGYYIFYRLLQRIADTPISLDSGDFAMMSRRVVKVINSMPEGSRFLRGMRSWVGFEQKGVEYVREARAGGDPKYTVAKLFRLAYDGIFNFSVFPLKFLTLAGIFCLSVSLVYFIITLLRKFIYNDVPVGFTALLFMIILFGGIQLISIGIIGEYVSRTFMQVKDRPLFIIKGRIKDKTRMDE